MKTSDFISALAADAPKPGMPMGRRITLALVAGAVVSLAFFISLLGPRPDIADAMHTLRFDFKFVDTLALLMPSAFLCLRLSRPEVGPGVILVWLAAPVLLLVALMFVWRAYWVVQGQHFYEIFFRFDTRATGISASSASASSNKTILPDSRARKISPAVSCPVPRT